MSTTRLGQVFKVKCRDCDFEMEVETISSFEHAANEHINHGDGFGLPHYEHTVEAQAVWVIGRNV